MTHAICRCRPASGHICDFCVAARQREKGNLRTAETAEIRTAYNEGTITAALHLGPNPDMTRTNADRLDHRVPMIGVDWVSGIDDAEDGMGPQVFSQWLTPEYAIHYAHRLLTLAYQAGAEIAE